MNRSGSSLGSIVRASFVSVSAMAMAVAFIRPAEPQRHDNGKVHDEVVKIDITAAMPVRGSRTRAADVARRLGGRDLPLPVPLPTCLVHRSGRYALVDGEPTYSITAELPISRCDEMVAFFDGVFWNRAWAHYDVNDGRPPGEGLPSLPKPPKVGDRLTSIYHMHDNVSVVLTFSLIGKGKPGSQSVRLQLAEFKSSRPK